MLSIITDIFKLKKSAVIYLTCLLLMDIQVISSFSQLQTTCFEHLCLHSPVHSCKLTTSPDSPAPALLSPLLGTLLFQIPHDLVLHFLQVFTHIKVFPDH